ncbi:hypothetical protein ADUPG1_013981 [Aduncisulcus paluster]|uniref:Uncharacterized protein n=1 Tax=Aduncisulcus paluster TaxID=2918883 RepID=A0ABQ5K8B7_9EUKA|nr:hypothetical protein ADUPG1_013981 [Aduncisulcus paluster]
MFYLIYKKNDSCVDGQLFLTNTNYILNFVQSCSQLLNIGPGIAALGGISKRVSDMASVLGIFSNSSSSSSSSSSSGMGSSSAKGSKGKKKRFDVKEEKVPLLSEMTSEDLRYNGDEMGELGDISGASGRMSTAGRVDLSLPRSSVAIHHPEKCGWFDVTVLNPNNVILVRNFTYEVEAGESVVIVGPSGCGKSSLLRVLAGIWPVPEGYSSMPKNAMFVPQTPYLINKKLAAEITYPQPPPELDEEVCGKMEDILRICELEYLLQRFKLDSIQPWSDILSGGEKQRLGFARVLWHCPRFAVMDESTSALPQDLEERLLTEMGKLDITMISVAHRRSVIPFHKKVIEVITPTNIHVRSVDEYLVRHPLSAIPPVELVKETKYETSLVTLENEDSRPQVPPPMGFLKSVMLLFSKGISSLASVEFTALIVVLLITIMVPITISNIIAATSSVNNIVDCADGGDTIDVDSLWQVTQDTIVWSLSALITHSVMDFGGLKLGNYMRLNSTKDLHSLYFKDNNFYRVENTMKGLDNSDQRIVADTSLAIYSMCGSTVPMNESLFFGSQGAWLVIIDVIVFLIQLLSIHDWRIVITPIACFVMFVVIQTLTTYKVKGATAHRQKQEGNFRYVHSRYREFAESIAFYEGEAECRAEAERSFKPLIQEQKRLAGITLWASLTNHLIYELAASILPVIMVYIFEPELDIQSFQIVLAAIQQILASLCLFLNLAPQLAAFTGTLSRVSQMHATLTSMKPPELNYYHNPDAITMNDVSVSTPKGEALVKHLDMKVEQGTKGIVVVGPSGVGKSSLLRVVGGLWELPGNTRIGRPRDVGSGIFFVPQTPYLVNGASLRAQIVYPVPESQVIGTPAHVFVNVLKTCELEYLLDRYDLDSSQPWSDILSGGEKQRLGFARVLWHCPRFAVMDESTSALPQDLEERLLTEMGKLDITMISVAHRRSVIPFHDDMLEITKEGWKLFKLKKEKEEEGDPDDQE